MMPEIIAYLLKANTTLLLFYGGYHFILQRYTFHKLNRFYLLSGLVYSAVFPLIDVPRLLGKNEELKLKIGELTPDWQGSINYIADPAEEGVPYWQYIELAFWTGVIFLSLRLLIRLISLFRLHLQSHTFTIDNFRFRKISKAVNPFSFWRTIYLNPECHEASELSSILKHEQVHVRQLHTLDVLLSEISTILYWFNPGVWLMKKVIKANLEFITDQEVIRTGINSKAYQYALLRCNVLPQNPMPVNNFHFLTIKKRIAMINKKPSARINIGSYLLIFPAVMLLALIAGTSKASFSSENIRAVMPQIQLAEIISKSATEKDILEEDMKEEISKPLPSFSDTLKVRFRKTDEGMTEASKMIRAVADTASKTPAPIYIIDGVRIKEVSGKVHPDSIKRITVLKGVAADSYGDEGRNGVVYISTKPQGERLGPLATINDRGLNTTSKDQKISFSHTKGVVYIIDGKEATMADMDQLAASSIESIEVLKNKEAISRYGERARNGVILISTIASLRSQ